MDFKGWLFSPAGSPFTDEESVLELLMVLKPESLDVVPRHLAGVGQAMKILA